MGHLGLSRDTFTFLSGKGGGDDDDDDDDDDKEEEEDGSDGKAVAPNKAREIRL